MMQRLNTSGLRPNESDGTSSSINANSTAFSAILIALSILIVLSNAMVLVLYILKQNLRSKKNFLLASLAVSDVLSGGIVLPVTLSCNQTTPSNWNLCLTSAVLFRSIAFSTIMHILVITFEKYLSIIHPFYHQGFIRRKHLRALGCCVWGTSAGMSLLPLAWLSEGNREAKIRKDLVYFIVTFIGFFILPLILMIFAHIRMFKTISKSFDLICRLKKLQQFSHLTRKENSSTTELYVLRRCSGNTKKVVTPIALMLGTFVTCWLTWYLGIFFVYLGIPFVKPMPILSNILQTLVFLPSLINPLLYTYYKQDFRDALKLSVFKRCRNTTI